MAYNGAMPQKKLFQALAGLCLFASATAAVAAALFVLRLSISIQDEISRVTAMRDEPLPLATEIYDRHGAKIGELSGERRYRVHLKDLPPHLVQAFLSAEDKDFYHHFGISLKAIVRSAVANLRHLSMHQGASTITQQLARNVFLDSRKTFERKAKEALLALAIERRLSKAEILELYLNKIFLGNRSYGVEAAARNYFRKSAADLNVAEAALLAGLPKSPTRYAPHKHPKLAGKRQLWVLKRMEEDGYLGKGDGAAWARRKVRVSPKAEDFSGEAPYFIAAVQAEMARKFELAKLPQEGLRIYTTLDLALQKAAKEQLKSTLDELRHRTQTKRKSDLEGALVTIDPATGAVLAFQGGKSFSKSQFDRATSTRRRLGGLFVPVLVGLAFERGFEPHHHVGDDPMTNHHTVTTAPTLNEVLRTGAALTAAPLYAALGGGSVVTFAKSLGLNLGREDLGLALGQGEATPFEVAFAFATFANSGKRVEPVLIERVETTDGRRLYSAQNSEPFVSQAMGEKSANSVLAALHASTFTGVAASANAVSPDAFGLAGASDDLQNAWFAGGTSRAVSALWIGSEKGSVKVAATEKEAGDSAAQAWRAYMVAAPNDYRANPVAQKLKSVGPPSVQVPARLSSGPESRSLGRF